MKCPKCGTVNGKTNKFCRECGNKLEPQDSAAQANQAPAANAQSGAQAFDDLAFGSEMFDLWQLYESGDFSTALKKGEKVVEKFPTSTSAHSVLALICERIAERETNAGSDEVARDYLQMAKSEYEEILTLNPSSVADRQKLAVIRSKLAGHNTVAISDVAEKIKSKVKTLPPPVLAAGVSFIVIVILVSIITAGARKSSVNVKPIDVKAASQTASSASVTPTPNQSPALKVYTFQAPQTSQQNVSQSPYTAGTAQAGVVPSLPKLKQAVQPIKLPPLGNEMTLVAEPKRNSKKDSQVKPAPIKITEPSSGEAKQAPVQHSEPAQTPAASSQPDGSTLLARAIQLHDQGQIQDAVSVAGQAASAFQTDIAAGKNADNAKRGLANAQKLISIWQH